MDQITIIVEPDYFNLDKQDRNKVAFSSPIEYLRLFDLKKQLNNLMGIDVKLVNDYLYTAPLNGIVILYPRRRGFDFNKSIKECSQNLQSSVLQRLLLINIFRGAIFDLLEMHKLLGAVQDLDMEYWWECENRVVPKQAMYGLTNVAVEMSAEFQREKGDYCYFEGNKNECLPHLLARYLKTYANNLTDK